MHRLRVAAVLLLAVLLAAQLTLHNHSLIPEGGGAPALPCAVCAFGADTAVVAPMVAAVLAVVFLLAAREQRAVAATVRLTLPSRAPPRR